MATSRRTLIAANWKMNGDLSLLGSMLSAVKEVNSDSMAIETLICPPFTLLGAFDTGSSIAKGAQNVSQHEGGAFTGEISVDMLKASGCEYILVGHSERREIYSETDVVVAEKFVRVARTGLKPVLCLGESLQQRESGMTNRVLIDQLAEIIKISDANDWENAVIAYEPIWAIGTGKTATPEMAQETHALIREELRANDVTQPVAETIRILYGGSMKPDNAAELLSQRDIDGGLVGGASLDPNSFISILRAAS